MAEELTPLQKLIEDLSQKLGKTVQAKKGVDKMVEDLTATKDCIVDAATSPLLQGVPGAAEVIDFHLTKLPGSFGNYGINAQLETLTAMQDAMSAEQKFYETAIGIYNRIEKGLAVQPVTDETLQAIGYDTDAGALYNKDMDHPGSRKKFKEGADLHLQNRPPDPSQPFGFMLPDSAQIGDLVCLDGVEFIYDEDGADFPFPVGLQQPDDPCDSYGVQHQICVIEGGGQ